jgi:hypothetical protein
VSLRVQNEIMMNECDMPCMSRYKDKFDFCCQQQLVIRVHCPGRCMCQLNLASADQSLR